MGLTSHSGKTPKRADVTVAKNYLDEDEFDKFKKQQLAEKSAVEVHFEKSLKKLEQLESKVSKAKPPKKKKGDV